MSGGGMTERDHVRTIFEAVESLNKILREASRHRITAQISARDIQPFDPSRLWETENPYTEVSISVLQARIEDPSGLAW